MPRRKAKTRTKRKQNQLRRYRPMTLGGFPMSKIVKLRYCQTFALNPAAGGIATQIFRANGAYDPDQTGVGHQPANFDTWATHYDAMTVLGGKCTVTPVQTSLTGVIPGALILHVSEAGTDLSTVHALGGIDAIMEQPRLNRSIVDIGNLNNFHDGRYQQLTRYFSAKKFFGTKDLTSEPYQSQTTTNPTEQAFYEVAFVSTDDTNDPGSFKFRVCIDYIVKFSELKYSTPS